MKVVIDSIVSQIGDAEQAARWEKVLRALAVETASSGWKLYCLDRGGAPAIDGIKTYPFPNYRFSEGASDSQLLQKIGEFLAADVFASGAYTMPLDLPTLQLLISGASDALQAKPSAARPEVERRLALAFSSATICDAEAIGQGLLRLSAVEERGSPVISPIAWDTPGEPAGLKSFAQTVVSEIGLACQRAQSDGARVFRSKWRALREIQASVDV